MMRRRVTLAGEPITVGWLLGAIAAAVVLIAFLGALCAWTFTLYGAGLR